MNISEGEYFIKSAINNISEVNDLRVTSLDN
jgi:hypothetical protein